MSDSTKDLDAQGLLDRRSRRELAVLFVLTSSLFGLFGIDVVQSATEDRGFGLRTLLLGAAAGVVIGLGLTALTRREWGRGAGRVGQRLGRRAWRDRRLPSTDPERALVLADLRRRQRTLSGGIPPFITAAVWLIIGAIQVDAARTWFHTVVWVIYAGVFATIAVISAVDRRHLPELRALLDEANGE